MKFSSRNLVSYLYGSLLIMFGFVRRARKKALRGDYILSVYFHKPSKNEFESMIQWLIKYGFKFISVSEFEEIIEGKSPFPKGAVMITVDDGWSSNNDNVIQVASKYNIPLTLFVSTEAIERGNFWWSYVKEATRTNMGFPNSQELKKVQNQKRIEIVNKIKKKIIIDREALTSAQLQDIAKSKLITIGAHTHSHPIMPNCESDFLKNDLKVSNEKLASWLQKEVKYFAYPNGSYTKRDVKIIKEFDYRLAFVNEPQYITPKNINNIHEIPRFGYLDGGSFTENICRITGVWFRNTKSIFKK